MIIHRDPVNVIGMSDSKGKNFNNQKEKIGRNWTTLSIETG